MTDISDRILCTQTGAILTISINRPDKQNALTHDMYLNMVDILNSAETDDEINVYVIQGVGEHFTAGNDIADFLAIDRPIEEVGAALWLTCLSTLSKPLIAKVTGNAVGIGTTCLFHCDLVFSDHSTKFSMPFTQLGLCPEAAVSQFLPRLVGHQKASELLLLGKRFYPDDALQMGIINAIVDTNHLDQTVMEIALQLASLPQQSVRLTKQLLKQAPEAVPERMSREFKLFEERLHSAEAKAIFQQFFSR